MQLIFTWPLRMWGISFGEAHYYGWRWAIQIGPLHLFIGYARP